MKGVKKFLISLLACASLCASVTGLSACNGIKLTPTSDGGITITPSESSSNIGGGVNSSSSIEQNSSSSSVEDSSSVEVHQHEWTSETVVTKVDCTTQGVTVLECECGEQKLVITPALGHDRIRCDAKNPTCTDIGYNAYEKCLREGCTYTTYQEIPALGHDNVVYEGREATCTVFGWEAYTVCNRCHVSTYKQIPAKGHTYVDGSCVDCHLVDPDHEHKWDNGQVVVAATCTKTGSKTFVCTVENCIESKTEEIPAFGHDNTKYEAKAPGCETVGWDAYTVCGRCGYSTYIEIPALGHSYDMGKTTVPATCTTAGVMTFTCFCGDYYTISINPMGHAFGDWRTVVAATCTENGMEERICEKDPLHVETRTVAKKGHDWNEWITIVKETCGKDGQEKHVCANDATHVEYRTIPMTYDHNVNENTGVCSGCGLTIKTQLPTTPEINMELNNEVYWDEVDGAVEYKVYILPNKTEVYTTDTYIDLEEFFSEGDTLQVRITAIADKNGVFANSKPSAYYTFEVPGLSIVKTKGIGDAVNLLTGSYTEFADGVVSIFDENKFKTIRINEDTSVAKNTTNVTYQEGLADYLTQHTGNVTSKINMNASVGEDKIAKVTSGYEFEVSSKYETKSYSQTLAAFYDMHYYHIEKKVELNGYNAKGAFSNKLSDEFINDALAVGNGDMTPYDFIAKYGTHIVTSGIYGAKLDVHYELLTSKSDASSAFGGSIKENITAQVSASMKGVDFGSDISTGTTTNYDNFVNASNSKKQTKFELNTLGGGNVVIQDLVNPLSNFSELCSAWVEGFSERSVLIDVPDNSLFFVWDFLEGEEFAEAKDALNTYFYNQCNDSYYALKDKVSSLYSESVLFDEESGTLTVDFAGLLKYGEDAHLNLYLNYGDATADSTGVTYKNNLFTVYSAVEGQPIKKVVFKGAYYQRDKLNRLITTEYKNFAIKFDKWWSNDIDIEFDSFGYESTLNCIALDFSEVQSSNIHITIKNQVYMKGSNGENGKIGFYAPGKNITFDGDGELLIRGGHGASADAYNDQGNGYNGGHGGCGMVVGNLVLDMTGKLTVKGGDGGHGYVGAKGWDSTKKGYKGTGHKELGIGKGDAGTGGQGGTGGIGGTGGAGGNGGNSVEAKSIKVESGSYLFTGGTGGSGGTGGKGGTGGPGGDGGDDDYVGFLTDDGNDYPGHGGKGGTGGTGGRGGDAGKGGTAVIGSSTKLNFSYVRNGANGNAGSGGEGGDGGVGGNPGSYGDTAPDNWNNLQWGYYGPTGDKGSRGANGNP